MAYTTTTRQGIQVVDVPLAIRLFDDAGGDTFRVRVPLNTDGQGFGQAAVVATIPILKENGQPAYVGDLKVGDLRDGFVQPIVVAVSENDDSLPSR